jgi:hypothetical protein
MPVSYDFLWSELGIDSGANLELRLLNKLLSYFAHVAFRTFVGI